MRAQFWKRHWPKKILMLSLVAMFAGTYGALMALHFPTRVDALVGRPVYVQGTVVSAEAKPGGILLHIAIAQITPVQASRRKRTCQVKATWWMTARTLSVQPSDGDAFTAYGMLTLPPLLSQSGQPVRTELAKGGIYYSFDGRLVQITSPHSMFQSTLSKLTTMIASVHAGTSEQRSLLVSIVFGGSNLDNQTKQAFLAAGLLHVLAASGANVVLLTGFTEWGTRPIRKALHVPDYVWALLMIFMVWWFAGMCSFAPSITRAAWMATYQYTARGCRRTVGIAQSLLFAGAAMSVQSPSTLLSISSLLSFGATAAVARAVSNSGQMVRRFNKAAPLSDVTSRFRRGHKVIRWLNKGIRTVLGHVWITLRQTLWVEMVVSPLALSAFSQLTPYSLVSNLVAEPLLLVLLPASAIFMSLTAVSCTAPILSPFVQLLGRCVYALIGALQRLVVLVSGFPLAIVTVHPGVGFWVTLCAGCLAVFAFIPRRLRTRGMRMGLRFGRFISRHLRAFRSKIPERMIK